MKLSLQRFLKRLAGEAGVRALSFLFTLGLARRLGAEAFGEYMSAMAFAALFTIGVDLGTNAILVRDIARHADQHRVILSSSHALKLLAVLASYGLLAVAAFTPGLENLNHTLVLALGVVALMQTWADYAAGLFVGKEDMGWEAILKVTMRSLLMAPGFVALLQNRPVEYVALAMAGGAVLSYAAGALLIRLRFGTFRLEWNAPYVRQLLRASLPLWASAAFWILYDSQDILLLNYFKFPEATIGHFAGAAKILDVLRVYPVLFIGVFFPELSRLAHTDAFLFRRRAIKLALVFGGSLLLIVPILFIASPWIITLLYDAAFLPATPILRGLLPAFLGIGLNHLMLHLLIARGKESMILSAAMVACLSNLLLAWYFLPRMGVMGACAALAGSELAFGAILLWTLKRS